MNILYITLITAFIIVFLVSLIEYLTRTENEGLKFCILVIIAFLIFSFITSI